MIDADNILLTGGTKLQYRSFGAENGLKGFQDEVPIIKKPDHKFKNIFRCLFNDLIRKFSSDEL